MRKQHHGGRSNMHANNEDLAHNKWTFVVHRACHSDFPQDIAAEHLLE
jgi:hypothetical protein